MDSFIVPAASRLFGLLGRCSCFALVRALLPRVVLTYGFVDLWVLGNVAVAGLALWVAPSGRGVWVTVIAVFGGLRIFEIIVYQVNVLFFDEFRAKRTGQDYRLRGYRRLVLLALLNYAEIAIWFGVLYRRFYTMFDYPSGLSLDNPAVALYYSIVTLATVGYGDIHPKSVSGAGLVIVQTGTQVFMSLVVLARIVSLLPRRGSMDADESEKPPGQASS